MYRYAVGVLHVLACGALIGCPHSSPFGLSDTEHTFSREPAPWTLEIWGQRTPVSFVIEWEAAWLTVTPRSGASAGPDDRFTVVLSVNSGALEAGCNRTTVRVRGGTPGTDRSMWPMRTVSVSAVGNPPGEGCDAVTKTVPLHPTADVTLYESETGGIANGAGQYLFVGRGEDLLIRRGAIHFDIAGNIRDDADILEVVLTMEHTPVGDDTTPQYIDLARAARSWGEGQSDAPGEELDGMAAFGGDATWQHAFYRHTRWNSPGGDWVADVRGRAEVAGAGVYRWEGAKLVEDVQMWLDTPGTNHGWLIFGKERVPEPEGEMEGEDPMADFRSTVKRFATKEHAAEDFRPMLRVTYTHLP
ncbi:MAG: hypothetical protein ACLFTT_04580 [Candidatus Hydrogenedentota bacterium]